MACNECKDLRHKALLASMLSSICEGQRKMLEHKEEKIKELRETIKRLEVE